MLSFFSKKWKQIQNWLRTIQPSSHKKVLGQSSYKILCVDDDKSFCLFMQQLASSLGIQLDMVYSIQEAKEAIEQNPQYKALIIDGHLPDGSGFELVAWIREKKELNLPIGFISRIYQDAASFRLLKESLKVNYVLEKPISPAEVHQLFVQICDLASSEKVGEELFSEALLADLKFSYQKTIADKIERLEKVILDVQKKPSIENLQILKGEVHKIGGSAGSYGYMSVSELCKNLELELIKQMNSAKEGFFNHQWLALLDDFFTQIKLHFQMKIPEMESQGLARPRLLSSVYFVDEDQAFLSQLAQPSQNFNFEILTESHPNNAIQTLLAADFYPQILFIYAHYRSSSLTAYEMIKAFYQKNDELTNVIALTVEAEAIEDQIEAFQRGMPVIIAKPFLPSLLLPLLDQIPFRALPLHYKILVIDHDSDICHYILKALKYTGLEVKVLDDFLGITNTLKSYQPDLILLDIHLHDETSIKFLHQLRKEWGYKDLLVGMLTFTQHDTHLLQQCYEANIDDILFKPLEIGVLQRKIAFLFKKKTEEVLSTQCTSQIGLESIQIFKRYLNELSNQYLEFFPKILIVFELKGLSAIKSNQKKEIEEYIFQAFEDLLKKHEMAAHLGEERFAIIFQGYDPHFVQLFMRHFLQRIHSDLQHNFKMSLHIDAALVILSKGESAADILQRGEGLLILAQQQSQHPLRLVIDPSFTASKEVFIFCDDMQPLDFLRILFQDQGFKVTHFSTLEGLPELQISLPFFILADSFAEAKGLQLLKKLMTQNQIQIPVFYFPHLPTQEHLQRLLNEINYYESPFGLVMIL